MTPQTQSKTLADFRPFQAWRYNLKQVQIDKVIAPPYDVISPAEQEALYKRDGHNCIRLILNKEEASDNDQQSRYTRARDFFHAWQNSGVLTRETEPSFYYYLQHFKHPVTGQPSSRSAILGRLKLEAFENKVVIPHEKTLSKPRADRRRLLEATKTNFSPVFGLYEHDLAAGNLLAEALKKPALFEAKDDQGVLHALWALTDTALISKIHEGLVAQRIYIADGHHRYQTSLEYAQEQRKAAGVPADQELDSDFVLMALVHFYDPGLVILPTHRMILPFAGYNPEACLAKMNEYFTVQKMPWNEVHQKLSNRKAGDPVAMGLYFENGLTAFAELKDLAGARKKMPQGKADLWYGLDVSLVSHLILGSLWGVSESEWESTIRYTHSDDEALQAVRSKKTAVSIFLNAPRVELLRDMGNASELMPQKSTYFYPKLASGLVFNEHRK